MDKEAYSNGIDNLLSFWSTKIRENITKFFCCPSLLKILDDTDKQITKFESKKNTKKNINVNNNDNNGNNDKNIRRAASVQKRKTDDESILNDALANNKYLNPSSEKPKNQRSSLKTVKAKNENQENKKGFLNKVVDECRTVLEEDEKDEEKRKEHKKMTSLSVSSRINNLESCLFHFHREKAGKNILTIMRKKKTIIGYLDIDLFLQRIAIEQPVFDNIQDNDRLFRGFCLQHPTFINSVVLVTKMISCFNYFYSRYLNQNNDNGNNNYFARDSSTSEINDLNNELSKTQQQNNNTNEIKDSLVYFENLPKIPYAIVDLVLNFVEIHNKYSKSTLSSEVIRHIENYYNNIMDIYEIKNRFEKEITESKQMINAIKNGKNIRRSKAIDGLKPLFENICVPGKLLEKRINDSKSPNSFFNLLSYDSKTIATELTRITYKILSKIEPKEFFKGVFTKKNKLVTSPNITKSIERFNKLSFWVIEEIISYDFANDRAKIIEKFIDIANELKNLNNFNDCMSVISGLGQMIITQLVKTWKSVSSSQNKVYLKVKKLFSFEDNYKNLREQTDKCIQDKIPYIPFMGIYNKRICFLEEYGPYVKERSLVNVDKIALVQQILDQFYEFTKVKYNFIEGFNKNNVIMILQCLEPKAEEELEKTASYIEPNFVLGDKKSHVKRVTNTEINFKNNYEKLIDIL